MDFKFDIDKIELVRLTENELVDLTNFDCEDLEMNRFFREEAFTEQEMGMNTTILLYYERTLAAACSICCDAITLSQEERETVGIPYAKVPAIKVARLGRSAKYRNLKFGKFLVEYVKSLAYELNEETVGVRFLTLDAYPQKVSYYQEELGFVVNKKGRRPKDEKSPISMRADIFPKLEK
ncbi:hypothetical protein [Desulfotruncus alcoholivorax]|uniref:hypothetical protein n=1 Tax=Desulfotruncus alcoholivorax TaxID=265477 RepID=UPI000413A3FB|nr:hypothetical protein [Desulfotruncus alcoholivorax]